jgi:hypothetical protein
LGALGIFLGFAVFRLIWIKQEHDEVLNFLLAALPVGGGLALLFEYVRHVVESERPHDAARWCWPRLVAGIAVTATFELFVIAGHEFFEHITELSEIGSVVLGPELAKRTNAFGNLAAFSAVWLVAGAAISAALVCVIRLVHNGGETPLRRFGWPAATGALIGGVVAPACALLGVVIARMVRTASWTVENPGAWQANLRELAKPDPQFHADDQFHYVVVVWPLRLLASLGTVSPWLPLAVVALVAVVAGWSFRQGQLGVWSPEKRCRAGLRPLQRAHVVVFLLACAFCFWTLTGFLLVTLNPLLHQPLPLLRVGALTAVVWLFPGVVLGALVPVIQRASESPRQWGFVAFAAAVALGAVTLLRTGDEWTWFLALVALIVAGTGVLFWRGWPVREYWPLAALSAAVLAATANGVAQTSRAALVAFHDTLGIPLEVANKLKDPFSFLPLKERAKWDAFTPDWGRLAQPTHPPTPQDFDALAKLTKEEKLLHDRVDESQKEKQTRMAGNDRGPLCKRFSTVTELWKDVRKEVEGMGTEIKSLGDKISKLDPAFDAKPDPQHAPSDEDKARRERGAAELQSLKDNLDGGARKIQETMREVAAKAEEIQHEIARYLELCVTGAYGLWVTAGLLMGWKSFSNGV